MVEVNQEASELVPGAVFNCETNKMTTQHDPNVREAQAKAQLDAARRTKPRADAREALARLASSPELKQDDVVAVLAHLLGDA